MDSVRNVGTMDAYIRIALGLATLTWVATGNTGRWGGAAALLGSMQVAAGITRYCPMLDAIGTTTLESLASQNGRGSLHEHSSKGELPNPFSSDV